MNRDELRERNAEIARVRTEGSATLEELARRFSISRERVLQISNAAGVDSRAATAALQNNRKQARMDVAEELAPVILMRWISGEDIKEIAKDLEIGIIPAKAVLDELVTDQMIAARSNSRLTNDEGPRDLDKTPREDRHWTGARVFDSLVQVALDNGGTLPTSTQYMKMAKENNGIPSFSTVRNRCGRWSAVRVLVHDSIKKRQA